jgi:hypothetical protein
LSQFLSTIPETKGEIRITLSKAKKPNLLLQVKDPFTNEILEVLYLLKPKEDDK